MAEEQTMRLKPAAEKLNVGTATIVKFLSDNGFKFDGNPNAKLNAQQLQLLSKHYNRPDLLAQEARRPAPEPVVTRPVDDDQPLYRRPETARPAAPAPEPPKPVAATPAPALVVAAPAPVEPKPVPAPAPVPREPEPIEARLPGLTVVGKIDLNQTRPAPAPQPAKAPEAPSPIAAQPAEAKTQPPAPAPAQPEAPKPTAPVVSAPQPVEAKTPVTAQPPVAQPSEAQPVVAQPSPVQAAATQPTESRPSTTQPSVARPDAARPSAARPSAARPDAARPESPKPTAQPVPAPRPVEAKTPAPPVAQPPVAPQPEKDAEPELIEAKADRLQGLTVLGKIELPVNNGRGNGRNPNPVASSDNRDKKKRKRIHKPEATSGQGAGNQARPGGNAGPGNTGNAPQGGGNRPPQGGNRPAGPPGGNRPGQPGGNRPGQGTTGSRPPGPGVRREEPSDKQIQDQIKATMARLSGNTNRPNFGADRRRDRRRTRAGEREAQELQAQEESKNLKVTEFISANDLASFMDVSVNEVISVCMSLGMFVSINQRLDAEAITIIADEFGFAVQFVSAEEEIEAALIEVEDTPADLLPRAPIVTIMGHVDHGKTSLLDYIRRAKVAAGEAGGITQHIGAYDVETDSGKRITFLDTPGHEAFTAMRARGAQVTDVVIIVIAADDSVMPQTREAINHAQNANVPIVFAFSKVDKAGADTEKIRQELAQMNLLVEEWGGKYQTQEISSKSGLGVSDLLEKVLLEAELLELTANPNKRANGAVIEASLDKGRGYVTTVLVQTGTLNVGDVILAGDNFGRVKAMFDHLGHKVKAAGPSTPVLVLGLNGAPQAGDKLNAVESEREAREIANKREQILREQNLRTRKHITLEEIGRRKAIGTFRELNVIVKGDVDGSVEALSDSLLKLSTEEVQVRIIHKGVGQVSESDVLLASTSDAVVVAFQVRPSANARRIAEQEQIEIRNYSIIYDAINDVRDAMEGLLAPSVEENITATIEVREVFKISKIGTVAGCYVTDGTVKRNHKIRVLRDFVVVHEGEISALKRFKDDVGEVRSGYECGVSIRNFNDIELGDTFECYELKEVKRTL